MSLPRAGASQCSRFAEWAQTYGDIYSVGFFPTNILCSFMDMLGQIGPRTLIVLSSAKATRECLEVNSAATSGRPAVHVAKLVYQDKSIIWSDYGSPFVCGSLKLDF